MVKKDKIGLVLAMTRSNAIPTFCALFPQVNCSAIGKNVPISALCHSQEEKADEGGWNDPAGFHLIPLPFADDMRAAPIEEAYRGK